MPRRRVKPRLPHSVYLAYFSEAAKIVRAAGYETLPGGGIFGRQEMDRMDEWCEGGKPAADFAAWVIQKRHDERTAEMALADQNMGQETISPKDVAA